MSATHKIVKHLDAEIRVGVRTSGYASQIDQVFLEGGLQYKFSDYVSVEGSYRLSNKNEGDAGYFYRHKLFIDTKFSVPAGRFDFSGRLRLQRTSETYIRDDDDLNSDYIGRFKLKARYDIPHLPVKPFVYYEGFMPLERGAGIQKTRFSAGADIKLTNKTGLEAGYIFQKSCDSSDPSNNILSLSMKFKF
jgi:hypothetical protein